MESQSALPCHPIPGRYFVRKADFSRLFSRKTLTGTVPQILSLEIYPQYYTCMHIHVLYRWPLRLGLCKICRSKSFFLISLFFIENRSVNFKIHSRCLILQEKSATRVFSSTLKRLMPSFQPEIKTSRDISLQRSLLMSNSPLVLWAHPPLLPHREGAYIPLYIWKANDFAK